MLIEELNEDNIAFLIPLLMALWPDCDKDEVQRNYRALINSGNGTCYLVKENEDYIGFLHVGIRNDYVEGSSSSPVAYIEGIYVKPSSQKLGVGRKLVAAAELWAKEHGFAELASDTEIDNTGSILFHLHAGFEESGRVVYFIKKLQ